jgi:hypothetical protein
LTLQMIWRSRAPRLRRSLLCGSDEMNAGISDEVEKTRGGRTAGSLQMPRLD